MPFPTESLQDVSQRFIQSHSRIFRIFLGFLFFADGHEATLARCPCTPALMDGRGLTLAAFVAASASCSVMGSPLCHHYLLLGPGQNQ